MSVTLHDDIEVGQYHRRFPCQCSARLCLARAGQAWLTARSQLRLPKQNVRAILAPAASCGCRGPKPNPQEP